MMCKILLLMLTSVPRFDNVRIPRENLLNSVADVSPDGQYLSAIKDPDQVIILTLRVTSPIHSVFWLLLFLTCFCHLKQNFCLVG